MKILIITDNYGSYGGVNQVINNEVNFIVTSCLGEASVISREPIGEDVYPDVGAYAQYAGQAAAAPRESLQDWMDKTFGGGMRAATPVAPAGERAYARPTTPTKVGAPTKPTPKPTPTFTTQPVGKVGPYKPVTYTPKTYIEAMGKGEPTDWTPGPTGISPAAGYYAGLPKKIGDIKFW